MNGTTSKKAFRLVAGVLVTFSLAFFLQCQKGENETGETVMKLLVIQNVMENTFIWNLPEGFPTPDVPESNPMSYAKIKLGRRLFYDKRLSRDGTRSCASCHHQNRAFSDGKRLPTGITSVGHTHIRNAQHLTNVAYSPRLNWADNATKTLEDQATGPLFQNGAPIVELGLTSEDYKNQSLGLLEKDDTYPALFQNAFGDSTMSFERIRMALANFERTLISGNSAYDRYQFKGDTDALSSKAKEGMKLFFGERAECFHCHGGFNFTDTSFHDTTTFAEVFFHDNGNKSLEEYYAIPGTSEIPATSYRGLAALTGSASDTGKFRAPSLRNVGLTYPYFHDGSVSCDDFVDGEEWRESCARNALLKIVNHYAAGGYRENSGNSFGLSSGSTTNLDAALIRSFSITTAEKEAIVEFLLSLSDTDFTTSENFSNPEPDNPLFGP